MSELPSTAPKSVSFLKRKALARYAGWLNAIKSKTSIKFGSK